MKWIMAGISLVVGLVAGVLLYSIVGEVDLSDDANWPHHGQADVLIKMSRAMLTHDCMPEMRVMQRGSVETSGYNYWQENEICQANYAHQKWIIGDHAVTGVFRCDLNDRTAEYAMTRFRYKNPFGSFWCQYKIFPTRGDQGLGKNFEVTWPTPWYDFTDPDK